MRRTRLLIFSLTFALLGCKHVDTTQQAFKETVLTNYLALVDSSGKFDTSDMSFKALKAYKNNDTTYLKQLDTYIHRQKTERKNWDLWQSDIPLPKLNQLKAETAFRFTFSLYGEPAYEVITITQNVTTYKLHYLYYYHHKDSFNFEKRREFEKSMSEKDWQEVATKLLYADFWGLKGEQDYRGADGNDLTVIGYQNLDHMERSNYVHRCTNTTLNDAFYYVYYKLLKKSERLFGTE